MTMTQGTPHSGAPLPRQFRTTRWSMVLAAGAEDSTAARHALEELARHYWYPLYAYLRRQGSDRQQAEDMTQGFFARLLERRDLETLVPEGGRFRSYLLTCLKNYTHNQRERERAAKRGGGQDWFSIDGDTADERYQREPFHESTPEDAYEKHWARSILVRSLEVLEKRVGEKGQGDLFAEVKGHLVGDGNGEGYRAIAERLGMNESAVKVAIHRLRKKFAAILREEIAQTVADPAEVDDELRCLFEALSR